MVHYATLIDLLKAWRARWGYKMPPGPHLNVFRRHLESFSGRSPNHYPSKLPESLGIPFKVLQPARLLHLYNGILLTMHLTVLRLQWEGSLQSPVDDFRGPTGIYDTPSSLVAEAADIADWIVWWADLCVHNAWQTFGPVIGSFNLNAALAWYDFERMVCPTGIGGLSGSRCREANYNECVRRLALLHACNNYY